LADLEGFIQSARGNLAEFKLEDVRGWAVSGAGDAAVVMHDAVAEKRSGGDWDLLSVEDSVGRRWLTSGVRGLAYDADGDLWIATLAGVARRTDEEWAFFEGQEGLPYNDFSVAAAGPRGIWFGTHLGAIYYSDGEFDYRQGRAWLPGDDVRDVAVDGQGNAWFATDGGIGVIRRVPMTLKEKAARYEQEIEYIKRTEYGYVAEASLKRPGDKTDLVHHDSDNDGLWTAMYGAAECFAYAATKDPAAKARAKQAFEALRFLQKVTQGGPHPAPKGYIARSILPTDGPDPNEGRLDEDRQKQQEEDKLWKVYEPRWPVSEDGKWYWKSDTSSDEMDGHYFFYPLYYDFCADSDEERERVREVVRDLTDHLIEHDYYLVDHTGSPTRWGYYSPTSLGRDYNWWVERGLNSLSLLSYLSVAEHVTGDAKYGEAVNELIEEHGYGMNAMVPKVQFGFGSLNQSDDEMAFMCAYNLLRYASNEELRNQMQLSFYHLWCIEEKERNPFFNFAYAAHGLGAEYEDQWGTHRLDPWPGWLDDSVEVLLEFPLDRLNWGRKNSHRIDIVPLPRLQAVEPYVPMRPGRGYRVDGKVLPVAERHFNHWNTDPWDLDYHGNGRELGSGTVFLLPYYMGLYHGFIEEGA
ncbi:MAG: hypothetical protein IT368_18770, partial [Candidatus Hydrogenedentes bacterium]|nr:hypothetical protein [Candidatus Hydrogenedentota bacterium]